MKRIWRKEGESLDSYSQRLEEVYDEFFQSEEGMKIVIEFKNDIERISKTLTHKK